VRAAEGATAPGIQAGGIQLSNSLN